MSGDHAAAGGAASRLNGNYTNTPTTCVGCHLSDYNQTTNPNHAAAQFPTTCQNCHTETAWRTTRVDHARTAFPLRGKHAAVECAKCHVKPAALVKPRSDTCVACHTDPHRGVFKQDCGSCHTESSFQKGTFDHGATRFALADKHAGLACVACHKTARPAANDFRGLKTSCESCHADVHRGTPPCGRELEAQRGARRRVRCAEARRTIAQHPAPAAPGSGMLRTAPDPPPGGHPP